MQVQASILAAHLVRVLVWARARHHLAQRSALTISSGAGSGCAVPKYPGKRPSSSAGFPASIRFGGCRGVVKAMCVGYVCVCGAAKAAAIANGRDRAMEEAAAASISWITHPPPPRPFFHTPAPPPSPKTHGACAATAHNPERVIFRTFFIRIYPHMITILRRCRLSPAQRHRTMYPM